jgi:GH15 family glucan-1,4-alpha-glucosidase
MNQQLYSRSIDVILENQSIWGSYIASPTFPTYHYCWLRDSSYIAYAMDVVGHSESAEAYFRWVGNTINRYATKVDVIQEKILAGRPIGRDEVLHTRYTLDGHEGVIDNTWGNFQIDGYGTWLWALTEHVRKTGNYDLLKELEAPINTTIQFLKLTWKIPNYDCWEEHPEYVHPYSLACVYGGLNSIKSLINEGHFYAEEKGLAELTQQVQSFIKKSAVVDGRLIKYLYPPVEAKLPGL